MLFARDGTLFATVGDSDSLCCNGSEDNSERMRAQDLSTDFGKVLRIRDDGSIPPDNPFVNRPGARPEFFTDGKERVLPRLPSRHTSCGPRRSGRSAATRSTSCSRGTTADAAGLDRPQLHRNTGVRPVVVPRGHGPAADVLGAVDQSVEPPVLQGDRFKGWDNSMFLGALNGKSGGPANTGTVLRIEPTS